MKKILTAIALMLAMAGCATTETAQQGFYKTCAAYNTTFAIALQLRVDGKLNKPEIDSITLLDSQVTPLCTGALPADADTATKQVTAAITTLTILEATKKVSK